MKKSISIYTDGGCHGNPGPGAWGTVVIDGNNQVRLSGGEERTTNNRMELTAAIKALSYAKEHCPDAEIRVFIDSQYVKKGITEWILLWKSRNWKTASKTAVLNQDLWKELDSLNSALNVEWSWVKGHSGVEFNEICDELCQKEIAALSH